MRFQIVAIMVAIACFGARARAGDAPIYPDQYNVVWTSPSADASGAMPLGNGDIGVNAWVEKDGDLLFYISKTDAWSENVRLLKLARVRVKLRPNPFAAGAPFRQELRLRQGEIVIRAGKPEEEVALALWVDANRPVIHVEATGKRPFDLQASLEIWRNQSPHTLTSRELFSAYGVCRAPHPVVESGDVALSAAGNRLCWYHRNETSVWAETLRLQGLEQSLARGPDPLLHRTFGGAIRGAGLVARSPTRLASAAPRAGYRISVYAYTAQRATVAQWLGQLERLVADVEQVPIDDARAAHRDWWRAFWQRSRVQVAVSNPADAVRSRTLPAMSTPHIPLCFGATIHGKETFTGDIGRVRVYGRALAAEEIAAHARRQALPNDRETAASVGDWTFEDVKDGVAASRTDAKLPAVLVGDARIAAGPDGPCVRLGGKGYVKVAYDPALDLRHACTLEAWICPRVWSGRLIDRGQGGDTGYMLDCYGGLRTILRAGIYGANPQYKLGQWMHVAMTFDTAVGTRLYANGRLLHEWPAGSYDAQPEVISRGYALQRFITAGAGRGAYPIKFNGSIFTVDGRGYDADYRAWGGPYWIQNTRLAYWPMLAGGDYEMMLPLFRMFQDAMPLATERASHFFHHAGAYFPETVYFWGSHTNDDYGWDRAGKRPGDVAGSGAISKHYNGNLELLALMLDYYAHTGDAAFARTTLVPMAGPLLLFWEQHYPRKDGEPFRITGGHALESYHGVTNPMPDVAGLHWVLDGLLRLPEGLLSADLRARWEEFRRALPPVPTDQQNGVRFLGVSERPHGGPLGPENPELYAVFPYRIYGVGKPDLELARRAFSRRVFQGYNGWEQDDIQAAMLGLTDIAAQYVAERFATLNRGQRFPVIWGPNYDWVPDQDHGDVAMRGLQAMLLQEDGARILLLPAWPANWDVDFLLHAAQQTTVECCYRGGKIQRLVVTPAARAGDVVVMVKHRDAARQ
jgi:hypothetical protein